VTIKLSVKNKQTKTNKPQTDNGH